MELLKPLFVDIEYNLIGTYASEPKFYIPETQSLVYYWTDGVRIYWRHIILEDADIESFGYYCPVFSKDKKHCYLQGKILKNVDVNTFKALNPCFAKDKNYVWTLGGRAEVSDIDTFEVCDDGIITLPCSNHTFKDNSVKPLKSFCTSGYAKDKNCVYVETTQGKLKIVKKANPATFISLNIGDYGYDDKYVFCEQYILPKANPKTWSLLSPIDRRYSKDDKNVYFRHKKIDAEIDSFKLEELVNKYGSYSLVAKDKYSYFSFGERMTPEEFANQFDNSGL